MRTAVAGLLLLLSSWASAGEITVEGNGSLHDALRQAREWRRTGDARCQGGITITVKAGHYYMSEPLFLRPEDSGTQESPLVIRGEEGTIIGGDTRQQHTQLWPKVGMAPLIGFDTSSQTITIATPPEEVLKQLAAAKQRDLQLEMVVHQRWAIAILRIKSFTVQGDSVTVTFMDPESRIEFDHPWPQPVIGGERGNSSFLLRATERRQGVEQLVIVDGASHVAFEGITFERTCWNRPQQKGHVTLQGGFPLIDAYKLKEHEGLPWDEGLENQAWIERPVSAVSVSHGSAVSFSGCTFRKTGATALDFIDDTKNCSVTGCRFEDVGGTAIMAGSFAESPREVHRPYNDLAIRCNSLLIKGNAICRVGQEDWGTVAISCGYVQDTDISANDISDCPYSGICVGWGWTPHDTGMRNNHIYNNKVERYACQLYDTGGIYTLSNQPGSSIRNNALSLPSPAPYATNDRAFPIYLDARTDGFTISGNSVAGTSPADTRLVRRDEIGDNHPGPNIIFK